MAEEPPPQRDWTHLPGLLLDGIMRRSAKLPDFIRFQAVCKPWRQALLLSQPAELQNPHKFRQSLPWLILPCDKPDTADCRGHDCHHFVDVAAEGNNKCRRLHVDLARGQYTYPQCLGSAFGWLLIQELWWPHPLVLYLLNPLTRAKIRLINKIRHGGGDFR
ncbi:unnamed protein product [Linum trigynum]|uniref:F-box domain-containing protein n=1 Tax=Linum trigynum TaxID=586398 RepID=A0AAV2CS99_9ROSI